MDLLVTAGRTLGFSLAAGVNLYATVAILGLATRFGVVDLNRGTHAQQVVDQGQGGGLTDIVGTWFECQTPDGDCL